MLVVVVVVVLVVVVVVVVAVVVVVVVVSSHPFPLRILRPIRLFAPLPQFLISSSL